LVRRTFVLRPASYAMPSYVLHHAYVIADVTDNVIILLSYALRSCRLAPCCPVGLTYCRPTSYHLTSCSPTFYAMWSCILWTCVLQLILLHSAIVLSYD
jgi:hypothetical protein